MQRYFVDIDFGYHTRFDNGLFPFDLDIQSLEIVNQKDPGTVFRFVALTSDPSPYMSEPLTRIEGSDLRNRINQHYGVDIWNLIPTRNVGSKGVSTQGLSIPLMTLEAIGPADYFHERHLRVTFETAADVVSMLNRTSSPFIRKAARWENNEWVPLQ